MTAPLFFVRENGETGKPASPNALGSLISRLATRVLGRSINAHAFRHAKAFYLIEVRKIALQQVREYLGHSTIQQTLEYSNTGIDEQKAAFENGDLGPEPSRAPAPAGVATAGTLDAAVEALTAAFSSGALSADAFAKAVAALSSGSS